MAYPDAYCIVPPLVFSLRRDCMACNASSRVVAVVFFRISFHTSSASRCSKGLKTVRSASGVFDFFLDISKDKFQCYYSST